MTQEERDAILLNLQSKMGSLENKFDSLASDVKSLAIRVTSLECEVKSLKDDVNALKKDVSALKENVTNISRSVAVLEYDHGEKLQVLLDYHPEFINKFNEIHEILISHQNDLDDHSARLWHVESKLGITN